MNLKTFIASLALASSLCANAQTNVMEVNTKKIGAAIQPTTYGIFFEDINYAADGGLYGELVKNRSFEFPQTLMGWQAFGNIEIRDDGPFERCPHYVVLANPGHSDRKTGLVNEGYFGIGVIEGEEYRFSVWAKAPEGSATIRVQLIQPASMGEKQQFAETTIDVKSSDWQKYEAIIKSTKTDNKAQLRIYLKGSRPVCLEHISLFPVNTFMNRENGLRRDIAQALADLKPGLLRFPGGCIVEGTDLETRYQWKNSVGPVENRPLNSNRWEHTFDYRYFPDYYQSYGLGFFEFFQLAEDIGAEPLPVLNVGMCCQYQNRNNEKAHVPLDELQPYIDDCTDLVEFANGDTSTTWGRLRAQMGHPEPFNLKYMGIGNEQWDTLFFQRLKPFIDAMREKCPEIKIVGTSGPDSEGHNFDIGWQAMREMKADLVDEHFYRPETWFLSQGLRYDNYDRKGPKVFAGEYACHGKGKKWNHFETSLYEAAFMTGIERNADIVQMATYAPLLAHVDGWQWRPDMIWFDNTRMFKTVSYYVQQMYCHNKGTNVLPLTMDGKPVAGQEGQNGLFASAALDSDSSTVIIKVVNTGNTAQPLTLNLKGIKEASASQTITLHTAQTITLHTAQTITLHCDSPDAENSIKEPNKIEPVTATAQVTADGKNASLTDEIGPMTFRIYRIKK